MLIYERDPRQRQLQTIYVPQEPRRLMPSELAEEIVLTHPAQPPTSGLNEIRTFDALGALGAVAVATVSPAADKYFWVYALAGEHDDPAARGTTLSIRNVVSLFTVAIRDKSTIGAGVPLPIARPFLVPFGFQLLLEVDAIAAGQRVNLKGLYLDLFEAENHPGL